jgi:hypothetical protein
MSVFGGLYVQRFIREQDDEAKWEKQTVSTPVVRKLPELHLRIDYLLDVTIADAVRMRPAYMNGYRVVFLRKNKNAKPPRPLPTPPVR